ncbi:MAG: hypothetical protein GC160_01900 [Acidobacteria bacterium]|nr:hypothetical protein [Acidobacteriota bacterium]
MAYALFEPERSGPDTPPWRKGDILVARSEASRAAQTRGIVRLRPTPVRAGQFEYRAETLLLTKGKPTGGLAFDPFGRLYTADLSARRILRIDFGAGGALDETPWFDVPPAIDWNGDFALSPDGALFLSGGVGSKGRLIKLSLGTDPRPGAPSNPPVLHRPAYIENSAIQGFSFYDNDRVLFADGSGAYALATIDPAFDPARNAAAPAGSAPRYAAPELARTAIVDVSVMRNAWQDYLQAQPIVADAISWSPQPANAVPYRRWDAEPPTADLDRRLHRMYGWIAAGESAPLAYRWQIDPLTGQTRIGPETLQMWTTISRDDAVDAYLSYLAHCLWVQVHKQTPWKLHGYSQSDLDLLFRGENLYQPKDATGALFRLNEGVVANAILGDPVQSFAFLTGSDPSVRRGPSFIQANQRTTIFALTRWVMDHILHGSNPSSNGVVAAYGYMGYAPVETVFRRRIDPGGQGPVGMVPRHWAWAGCHTSAGFMVHLARLLNIPVRRTKLYDWIPGATDFGFHGGIDFPTERLACFHTDSFYASGLLFDPYLSPEQIYNGGPQADYAAYLQQYGAVPSTPAEATAGNQAYARLDARIAARNATHPLLREVWRAVAYSSNPPEVPCAQRYASAIALLTAAGLSAAEAEQLICDNVQTYLNFIADFRARHAAELPTSGTEQQQVQAAYQLYEQLHAQWEIAR